MTPQQLSTDVLVAGGGLAGLTCSLGLTRQGYRTTCVDPRLDPALAAAEPGHDNRVTALLENSVEYYRRLKIWDQVEPQAAPLRGIRIISCQGSDPADDYEVEFRSEDIGQSCFGWSVSNRTLSRAILSTLAGETPLNVVRGSVADIIRRTAEVIARLQDGSTIRAALVVAADGRRSRTRQLAGIGCRSLTLGLGAVVFDVEHQFDHNDTSLEFHFPGGALTFVPVAARDSKFTSAIVWIAKHPMANELAGYRCSEIERIVMEHSRKTLGQITLVEQPRVWPLSSHLAKRFYGPRIALIAEAAHVFPPIGAQGFNTSIADIESLVRSIGPTGKDPGRQLALQRYHRERFPEVTCRLAGTTVLNLASVTTSAKARRLRESALRGIGASATGKRLLMQFGMGTSLGTVLQGR